MMLAGGLLRLYWDSGTPVVPPPAPDDFPLGLENVARPNVNVRWGNRLPDARPAPVPAPAQEAQRERGVTPVPLRMVLAPSGASPQAQVPETRARHSGMSVQAACTAPRPRVRFGQAEVPALTVGTAKARPRAAVGAVPHVDDRAQVALRQRERNRRAIELALRLLEDE